MIDLIGNTRHVNAVYNITRKNAIIGTLLLDQKDRMESLRFLIKSTKD